jgi:hypothetical protein
MSVLRRPTVDGSTRQLRCRWRPRRHRTHPPPQPDAARPTHPAIGSARGCTSRRTRPRRRPRRDPDGPARAPARDGPERTVPPSWGRWRHCAATQRLGTAASASSARRVTAVRIDVRIRHTQRPQPQLTPAGSVSAAGAVDAQDAPSRAETGAGSRRRHFAVEPPPPNLSGHTRGRGRPTN